MDKNIRVANHCSPTPKVAIVSAGSGGWKPQGLRPPTTAARFTGFVSFTKYYRVKLTHKKFKVFEVDRKSIEAKSKRYEVLYGACNKISPVKG